MYGTMARLRVRPEAEAEFQRFAMDHEELALPGLVGQYVYRMDTDPSECYLVVLFESKDAYRANAASPEQDARYRRWRELLVEDPEWHDGEIILAFDHRVPASSA
jgi:heme-degrading monooxygenase HmoA